jgi:hypothetical protein
MDARYCSAGIVDQAKTVGVGTEGRTEFFIATDQPEYYERVLAACCGHFGHQVIFSDGFIGSADQRGRGPQGWAVVCVRQNMVTRMGVRACVSRFRCVARGLRSTVEDIRGPQARTHSARSYQPHQRGLRPEILYACIYASPLTAPKAVAASA